MPRLYEYVLKSRGMERESFTDAFPHPFLVVRHRKEEQGAQWSFKTQTVSASNYQVSEMLQKQGVVVAPEVMEYEVFPVAKVPGNPWPERISVGRARNNDIVLQDNSVSKLHGHFVKTDAGDFAFVDAGSRNGSKVGEQELAPSNPTTVTSGDTVTFGAATLTFVGSGEMFDLIDSYVQADKSGAAAD